MASLTIEHTPEFERIRLLPWHDWEREILYNDRHLRLSSMLKTPYGTMALFPIQAAALIAIHDHGGAFLPIPVGEGKTIVSFLAGRMLNAQRPALLIPAALRRKTYREFQTLYKHWFAPVVFMREKDFDKCVFNYEGLSRASGKDALHAYKPDVIIADEAHLLKNRDAACTRVVERFMYENPETRFVAMSGSMTSRSILDYWHIMMWCLREKMPLPRYSSEVERWADALDEKKAILVNRPDAKIFTQFLRAEDWSSMGVINEYADEPHLRAARIGFRNRLLSAPGIVQTKDERLGVSLIMKRAHIDPGKMANNWLAVLRVTKKTPNGEDLNLPTEIWRMARELACGFWYRWDPPPPQDWLAARRAWGWYERQILLRDGLFYAQYKELRCDSPFQLASAIVQGRIENPGVCRAYFDWAAIRDSYKHDVIAEWIDDGVLNFAAEWLEREKGIVWTEHRAFGEKLSAITGVGFCSEEGLDAQGKMIEDYDGRPVIASVQANHRGRNLQAWCRNLGVTFPPNGARMEQLLGRTHRSGQKANTVYFDWVDACEEQSEGFRQLLADARYIEDTWGKKQKVNFADHV
jgi:hypothetical protein